MDLILVIAIGLIIGILFGLVSIGGLLLAPAVSYLLGIDLHQAIAASLWSFLFTGIVGTLAYARMRAIPWRIAGWLSVGVIPATLLGARTNVAMSTQTLTILLAALIVLSGMYALSNRAISTAIIPTLNALVLILIGVCVGFLSALIGAGGGVLLVPILLYLNVPALIAVGICQVVQLPVAIFSSASYAWLGEVDFVLGTGLGILQAIGVFIGARIAHFLPATRLRQVVAYVLVGVGLLMIGQVF